jgi:transposase
MQISTIGIDLAKTVFQVHGVDAAEKPALKKQLRRGQVIKAAAVPRRHGGVRHVAPLGSRA